MVAAPRGDSTLISNLGVPPQLELLLNFDDASDEERRREYIPVGVDASEVCNEII